MQTVQTASVADSLTETMFVVICSLGSHVRILLTASVAESSVDTVYGFLVDNIQVTDGLCLNDETGKVVIVNTIQVRFDSFCCSYTLNITH